MVSIMDFFLDDLPIEMKKKKAPAFYTRFVSLIELDILYKNDPLVNR